MQKFSGVKMERLNDMQRTAGMFSILNLLCILHNTPVALFCVVHNSIREFTIISIIKPITYLYDNNGFSILIAVYLNYCTA